MGRRSRSPSGPSGHLPINGEETPEPLRPFGPPPHQWGGPILLRATSPSMGRRRRCPSGPSGHLPINGEEKQFSDQLGVAVEDLAQLARRFDAMLLHHVEEAEDV